MTTTARTRTPLYAWGLLTARRKGVVFMVWALLIAAGLAFIPQFLSALSMTGLWVPGSQSGRAAGPTTSERPGIPIATPPSVPGPRARRRPRPRSLAIAI